VAVALVVRSLAEVGGVAHESASTDSTKNEITQQVVSLGIPRGIGPVVAKQSLSSLPRFPRSNGGDFLRDNIPFAPFPDVADSGVGLVLKDRQYPCVVPVIRTLDTFVVEPPRQVREALQLQSRLWRICRQRPVEVL